MWNFKYHSGVYYLSAWNKCKDRLENLSAEEKEKIEAILAEYNHMENSEEYKNYLAELEAKRKANEEEKARQAALRAPKTSIKRSNYVYMVYQDFDSGEYNIICIDKKLPEAKKQFKEAAFDFLVEGDNADANMYLFKINIAAIKDTRFLDLLKEYMSDTYSAELSKEHNTLMHEYKNEFWTADWATCITQCADVDALEACYDDGIDPNELNANGEWQDWVRDYVDREFDGF